MDDESTDAECVDEIDAEPFTVTDIFIIAFDLVSDWHHDAAVAYGRLARAVAADANYRIEKRRFRDAITNDIESITGTDK